MPRIHTRLTPAITAILSATLVATPLAAHAQTVGGEIVGLESGKPVHGASVALVDDSANIVSSTAADTASGMFYIDAPHAGHYRVVLFANGGSFLSPAMQVDSAQTVERKFSVPDVPGVFRNAYFAQDVTTPARFVRLLPAPAYPESERRANKVGLVVVMFVVDEKGHVDRGTVQVINDAPDDFSRATRESLDHALYIPAIKDGTPVRQVVQLSVGFGVQGKAKTPPADVMVTALGVNYNIRTGSTTTKIEAVPIGRSDDPVPTRRP